MNTTKKQMAPVDNSQAIKSYDVSMDKDLDMFAPFYNQVQGDGYLVP